MFFDVTLDSAMIPFGVMFRVVLSFGEVWQLFFFQSIDYPVIMPEFFIAFRFVVN